MKKGLEGLPVVGRSARTLGVRVEGVHKDVEWDEKGLLHPGRGGMSVTVDDPAQMPVARRPTWLGRGASEDPLFVIDARLIESPLAIRVDVGAHALVEPAMPCTLESYEADLAVTQSLWRIQHGS
jgi:hypothetical protein